MAIINTPPAIVKAAEDGRGVGAKPLRHLHEKAR